VPYVVSTQIRYLRPVPLSPSSQVLALVADVHGLLDLDELRHGLLDALNRALPSEYVSLNDVGPDAESFAVIMRPVMSAEWVQRFARLAHENPLLRRYVATQDGRAYRFSDVVSRDELHALAIYRDFYAPLGVEHQMAFTLPHASGRILGVALSRTRHDYSDAERDMVNLARPFLIQAYQNAIAHDLARTGRPDGDGAAVLAALREAGLTAREAEVARLVALGGSNRHAAASLGISHRTVGKHLEQAFRKLGASDRSTAAARVWDLAAARAPRRGLQ
jgi:DNA-binding CsgD family transcriptional regulator